MNQDVRNYAALQAELEKRGAELKQRLQAIKHDLSKTYASDWSDQAQERENDEVLNQLGHGAEREIHDIDAALKRLQNDEYGDCLECGKLISMARLKIKPEAKFCTDCAHNMPSS